MKLLDKLKCCFGFHQFWGLKEKICTNPGVYIVAECCRCSKKIFYYDLDELFVDALIF